MNYTTENIYELFCCKLKPYILSWINNPSLADDIQQEVFIKIHEKIDTLKDDSKIKSWVLQITRNTIIDFIRKKKYPNEEVSESLLCEELLPLDDKNERDLENELQTSLLPLIESLPNKYRQAIKLVEFDGLSQVELAEKLHISISGAKSRVQRGRKMIKDRLMKCCHYMFDKYGNVIGVKPESCCCCE